MVSISFFSAATEDEILNRVLGGHLRNWVTCFAAVNFDIDVGPKIEVMYPADALTKAEAKQLSFHALPDSMSAGELRLPLNHASFFLKKKREQGMPTFGSSRPQPVPSLFNQVYICK